MNKKEYFKNLFTSYWEFLAIKTAAQEGIFDMIKNGCNTIELLSSKGGFNRKTLSFLIKALEISELIENKNGKLQLTEYGNFFIEDSPERLKYACIHWAEEHLTAWQNLDYTLKTGKSAFEFLFGIELFEYLEKNDKKLDIYHKAMYEYAKDDYKEICDKVSFDDSEAIMDVGGGYGALIEILKNNCKEKRYYLFDKPNVIKKVNTDNIKLIAGDFFKEIPNVADTILLSRVLHDWDDSKALKILQNVYNALPSNGKVYVIENFTEFIPDGAALLSLNMLLITESYERTEEEYKKLLNKANFKIEEIIRLNTFQFIIKAIKL